ncbi:hypothetical protein AVL50_02335 [Flammeovirga sp. SJP92]|nr:hypothetical protein AVL50_02335 [Flammeovirga sp. SJP92]
MVFLFNTILLIYLVISNIAILFKLYKAFLQYFSPLKGYASIALIVVTLGAIDFYVYDVTSDKFITAEENKEVFQQIKERNLDLNLLSQED